MLSMYIYDTEVIFINFQIVVKWSLRSIFKYTVIGQIQTKYQALTNTCLWICVTYGEKVGLDNAPSWWAQHWPMVASGLMGLVKCIYKTIVLGWKSIHSFKLSIFVTDFRQFSFRIFLFVTARKSTLIRNIFLLEQAHCIMTINSDTAVYYCLQYR